LFEKQDLTGASGNQGSAVDQEHLTKIKIRHLFEFDVGGVRGVDVDGLTLSVEGMNNMVDVIIKTLIRKVLLGTFHDLIIHLVILNISVNDIIEKVIMRQRIIIKKLNKYKVIVDKGTSAEWISESLNWHSVVVDAQKLIDIYFCSLDFFLGSLFLFEHSHSEFSIINIHQSILFTSRVLLNFLCSNE
jgi:hypothetical protein